MKTYILFFIVVTYSLITTAQSIKTATVAKFEKTSDNKLLVEYNIPNAKENETYDLEIFFYDNNRTSIPAFAISGDYPKVTGTRTMTLLWDVMKDRQEFPDISNVKIEIKSITGNQIAKKFITITSTPSGANLQIDGEFVGYTPYKDRELANGTHSILLLKDDRRVFQNINISDYGVRVFDFYLPEKKNELSNRNKSGYQNSNTQSKSTTSGRELPAPKIKTPKPRKPTNVYLSGSLASPLITKTDYTKPDFAYEFMLGIVKTIGVYAKYTSNFSEVKADYTIANFPNNYYYHLTSEKAFSRLGTVGGLMVRAKPVTFYAGAGWGYYNSLIKADLYNYSNDEFVKSINIGDKYSIEGIETNMGFIIQMGSIGLSAGVSSIEFKYYEINLGLGLFF